MPSSNVKELSAHEPPKTLAVADFWRRWRSCCTKEFGPCPEDVACIDEFKALVQSAPMFVHLREGLEQMLLNDRATPAVALTPKAWLSLTLLLVRTFKADATSAASANVYDPARLEQRKAVVAALTKASNMYKQSEGRPIEGMSMQDWIARAPWQTNVALWEMLFQQSLRLVHPQKEPLFWALREYWLAQQTCNPALVQAWSKLPAPPELAPWGLPRPMTLNNVQTVLRSGRRWALRAGNSMHDALDACAPSPQWRGVYLFSLWLHRVDNRMDTTPEELTHLRQHLVPEELAYWLVLTHDCAHHTGQRRNLLDIFDLHEDVYYPNAANVLVGLQMMAAPSETELAFSAWLRWQEAATQEVVALPELS